MSRATWVLPPVSACFRFKGVGNVLHQQNISRAFVATITWQNDGKSNAAALAKHTRVGLGYISSVPFLAELSIQYDKKAVLAVFLEIQTILFLNFTEIKLNLQLMNLQLVLLISEVDLPRVN